jgi:leader peptidase (prepilin peptidase)/N-methyltransferase
VTPYLFFGVLAAFGLIIGSFLNVCIGRLPAGESIVSPGSRCPHCRTAIPWYDNIPVASYVALGGRCRACRASISARYPATEIATALLFLADGLAYQADPPLLLERLLFTAILVVLFGTDLETQRLPNIITLPGIVIGLAANVWLPPGIVASVLGAALGGGLLYAIRWGWKRATGVEGMGLGDVKMLAMIGAFLGWRQVIVTVFLASFGGAVVGVTLALAGKRSLQSRLPFGTFLAIAAFAASIWGEWLLSWYLGFY